MGHLSESVALQSDLRMPRAGPLRRRGHQDVHVQILFYEVAESRAVDELDPIILLGFDPASRREP